LPWCPGSTNGCFRFRCIICPVCTLAYTSILIKLLAYQEPVVN
jgi:hypothetical protein